VNRFGILPSPMSRRGLTLMIHLFLDDSGKGSQPQNPWVCMAGYLAGPEALTELIGKWRQLLLRHGIGELHMKQLILLCHKTLVRLDDLCVRVEILTRGGGLWVSNPNRKAVCVNAKLECPLSWPVDRSTGIENQRARSAACAGSP